MSRPTAPTAPIASGFFRATAAAAVAGTALALPLALFVAPPDAVQGEAQRFMYLHVPAAWGAYLCFLTVAAACAWFLVSRRGRVLARAAAEVGVVLTALTLITGTVWGALTWGTWWAWDARIMTTAAMGLFYLAYLAADSLAEGPRGRAATAVLGVCGLVMIPLVHFSVVWWRTLHQPPTILAPGTGTPIDAVMGVTLAVCVITVTLWAVLAVHARVYALASRSARPTPVLVGERAERVGV